MFEGLTYLAPVAIMTALAALIGGAVTVISWLLVVSHRLRMQHEPIPKGL